MRKCTNCGVKQPEEQFYKGGHRQCKACLREKAQKRYQTDGGYEKQKAWQLKTWYGITTEEYEELLLKQSFRCA